MSDKVVIDVENFSKNLNKLYKFMEDDNYFQKYENNVFEVCIGQYTDNKEDFKKSNIIVSWLLGFQFTQTIFVFGKDTLTIATGKKKATLLKSLKDAKVTPKIQIVIKEDENENY